MGKGITRMYALTKRIFDLVMSLIGLIVFAPLFLIIAIIIKIESRGPVFFRQVRIGKDGRQFSVIKFRTMVMETDEIAHRNYLRKLLTGGLGPEKGALEVKLKMDPRITKTGRVLRVTALDELPQLLNIIKGDMSFVGPRAGMPFEAQHYVEWQKERLKCKPGLTGLWQVYAFERTGERSYEQMIKMDIDYIRRQSLLLDFKLIFKSFILSLRGERTI